MKKNHIHGTLSAQLLDTQTLRLSFWIQNQDLLSGHQSEEDPPRSAPAQPYQDRILRNHTRNIHILNAPNSQQIASSRCLCSLLELHEKDNLKDRGNHTSK
ncbi:hypothetical protein Leryth_023758 [Lithospermum erythrorhizon]|nr:hypothetical protein Leryth_023758 [Lithospermum erythrorhizon]